MENFRAAVKKRLFCLIYLVWLGHGFIHAGSLPAEKFVVQVAASKTPVNIPYLIKKYHLIDSVTEVKSDDWYRYVVGDFKSQADAAVYADVLRNKGAVGAFPRNFSLIDGIPDMAEMPDTVGKPGTVIIQAATDSIAPVKKTPPLTDSVKSTPPSNIGSKSETTWLLSFLIGNNDKDFLKKKLFGLSDRYLPLFCRNFCRRVIEKGVSYPVILFLVFLILVFVLNVVVVLLILYFSNRFKNRKDRHIRIFTKMYEEALLAYLFGTDDWEKTRIKLKRVSHPLNRKILVSLLFSVQENLKGGFDKEIPDIFIRLGLHHNAMKLAKSRSVYKKIDGIRQLTYLNPDGALGIIPNYLNAQNDSVRAEAQASYIRLHRDEPFGFFHNLSKPFTRWTQLIAFQLLRVQNLQADSFSAYLHSKHTNIREFCLKMIIYYQQLESADEVFKILDSKVESTRFLAIRAISDLRLYDGKDLLKARFPVESEKNRLEIIKAFQYIGNDDDLGFLESIMRNGSVSDKIEASRSLYFMNDGGRNLLMALKENPELEIERYIAHVTDPRN